MAITSGWGQQWDTLANAINSYYGGGINSSQYKQVQNMLNSGNYTQAQMESVLKQIPNLERTYSKSGKLMSVTYKENVNKVTSTTPATNTAANVGEQVNSNAQTGVANASNTVKFKTVQNITMNNGKASIGTELTKWRGGTPSTTEAVLGQAVSAIFAVGAGISLGKKIDKALYNANPDFWDSHGMGALNPDTWGAFTADDGLGGTILNAVFDLDSNGNPQMYMDENALAYMALYMQINDVLGDGHYEATVPAENLYCPDYYNQPIAFSSGATARYQAWESGEWVEHFASVNDNCVVWTTTDNRHIIQYVGTSPTFTVTTGGGTFEETAVSVTDKSGEHTLYEGVAWFDAIGWENVTVSGNNNNLNNTFAGLNMGQAGIGSDLAAMWNNKVPVGQVPPDGVSDIDGATTPQLNNNMSVNDVLNALKSQYPELWDNRIEFSPDGNTTEVYIPVGMPTGGTGEQPTSDGANQSDTRPDISGDSSNATDKLIKLLIELINKYKNTSDGDTSDPAKSEPTGNDEPSDTGDGSTPTVTPPTGSASSLWKIYNPTQAQVDSFGAWLWSSNFVEQIKKLFNDPMQAIIGLHKVFASPTVGGTANIKVGYLDSGVSSNYVSSQYVDVDCGSVNLKEYFGNVFDYSPYTRITLFLPFIGFVDIDNSDVMRGRTHIVYHVDVLTGACLAEVKITRDLNDVTQYTFSGNCAVQYPVSSGSYVGIVTGLLSIAGGIAGTVASGGALAPVLMGAGASIGAMHTSVKHSGDISANAGAMGCKKPYFIITRPQTKQPENGVNIEGLPQNETKILGSINGHVRVKKCHYDGIVCTSNELDKIKALLESGVYIN